MEKIITMSTKTITIKFFCYLRVISLCLVMKEEWNIEIYCKTDRYSRSFDHHYRDSKKKRMGTVDQKLKFW